jgi:hypothetical protein
VVLLEKLQRVKFMSLFQFFHRYGVKDFLVNFVAKNSNKLQKLGLEEKIT